MNELTAQLLEAAWQELPARNRSLAELGNEAVSRWIIWRNYQVEVWGTEILPYVKRRPASDYYWETERGDSFYDWTNRQGFYNWELPSCDGEDDDFVYHFIAHCLAVMAWLAFVELWPQLDYSEAEIEQIFNFKNAYAPVLPKKGGPGTQLSMF